MLSWNTVHCTLYTELSLYYTVKGQSTAGGEPSFEDQANLISALQNEASVEKEQAQLQKEALRLGFPTQVDFTCAQLRSPCAQVNLIARNSVIIARNFALN